MTVYVPAHQDHSEKRVYFKRKEFAPLGSKFFPFRVHRFTEGRQNHYNRVATLESVSIPLNESIKTT